jgi:RNA polymerase sigma-70 factor (ECF subfamily)
LDDASGYSDPQRDRRLRARNIVGAGISKRTMTQSGPDDRVAAADRRRSALMAAAQGGDSAAYQTLLRESIPLIRAIARRRGLPADRIDDVVQDVLLTVHRARHTFDPSRSFTAWLSVIADRRAIDVFRRMRRKDLREVHAPIAYQAHVDPTADPTSALVRVDAAGIVDGAIASLPERQREAVQRLVLEEGSLADVAAETRRSKGSLKVNLHRALKTLRTRMGAGQSGNE